MLFLTRLSHIAFDALIRSDIRATNSAKTDMCKELKCRVLKLVPGTANAGPAKQSGDRVQVSAWKEILSTAVNILKQGNVVAVPTDTVYGLACLAQNSEAIQRVYEMKGRNGNKPLAICVGAVEDIYKYCKVTVPDQLLRDLLPGPVTLVLERSEELNKDLNPFTQLVGVRIPDHAFMQVLAQKCGEPLALTSANISSQSSTLTVDEFHDLLPQLALVIDGGPIGDVMSPECRLGSTVVNLSIPGQYSIIRPGCALMATVEILEKKYSMLLETPDH